MNKYLVEFNAIIGRKKADISVDDSSASLHNPVQLKYFGVIDAASVEDATSEIVLYRDPGFVTSIVKIEEIPEGMHSAPFLNYLDIKTLVTEL